MRCPSRKRTGSDRGSQRLLTLLQALLLPAVVALLELRDEQRIGDIVLRWVQARLDREEVRLLRANPLE